VSLHRGLNPGEPGGTDPVGRLGATEEIRRVTRSAPVATGTLACPRCDAPVMPERGAFAPSDPLACPFCAHAGAVRDFLSLGEPTRPTRVVVRVVRAARR
jgi:hypothetical protein